MSDSSRLPSSTIENVLLKLKTAGGPTTEILHSSDSFQAIIIGFNKGDLLPEHTTSVPAKLTVLSGFVTYHDAGNQVPLSVYDELEIPLNIPHSVTATRRSICLLTKG